MLRESPRLIGYRRPFLATFMLFAGIVATIRDTGAAVADTLCRTDTCRMEVIEEAAVQFERDELPRLLASMPGAQRETATRVFHAIRENRAHSTVDDNPDQIACGDPNQRGFTYRFADLGEGRAHARMDDGRRSLLLLENFGVRGKLAVGDIALLAHEVAHALQGLQLRNRICEANEDGKQRYWDAMDENMVIPEFEAQAVQLQLALLNAYLDDLLRRTLASEPDEYTKKLFGNSSIVNALPDPQQRFIVLRCAFQHFRKGNLMEFIVASESCLAGRKVFSPKLEPQTAEDYNVDCGAVRALAVMR